MECPLRMGEPKHFFDRRERLPGSGLVLSRGPVAFLFLLQAAGQEEPGQKDEQGPRPGCIIFHRDYLVNEGDKG